MVYLYNDIYMSFKDSRQSRTKSFLRRSRHKRCAFRISRPESAAKVATGGRLAGRYRYLHAYIYIKDNSYRYNR